MSDPEAATSALAPGSDGASAAPAPPTASPPRQTSPQAQSASVEPLTAPKDALEAEDELRHGLEFPTGKAAVEAMQDYALRRGRAVRVARSSGADRRVRCSSADCGFFAQFYRHRSAQGKYGSWFLSSFCAEHCEGCASEARPTRRQMVQSASFRSAVQERGAGGAPPSANAVIARIQQRDGISLASHKRSVYRALDALHGLEMERTRRSFSLLPAYLDSFQSQNPGSAARLETDQDSRFKRAVVVAKVFADAVNSRQNVLALDCRRCEHQSYPGVQVRLMGRDGNIERFTIAFGLLPVADEDNLAWFFQAISSTGFYLAGLPLFCDREAAPLQAVADQLGLQPKYCVHRLVHHLSEKFSKTLFHPSVHAPLLWQIQAAHTEAEYRNAMLHLRADTSDSIADFVESIDPFVWCVFANVGKVPLYSQRTSNFIDPVTFNSEATKEDNELCTLTPFNFIQRGCESMVSDCYRRSELAALWVASGLRITAGAMELYQSQSTDLSKYIVQHASRTLSYVHDASSTPRLTRRVDLEAVSCTCEFIGQHHAPCRHVLAVLNDRNAMEQTVWNYFHACYSVAAFADAFKDKVVFKPIETEMVERADCAHPVVPARRGRPPTKKRALDDGQEPAKMIYQCSNCGQHGHNKRRCPAV